MMPPETEAVSHAEGEDWVKFGSCAHGRVHAIKFKGGLVWDTANGWRRRPSQTIKLTVNIATRGRPGLVVDTIRSMLENSEFPSTTIMVSVDDDDTETVKALGTVSSSKLLVSVKPREDSRGEKYDRALTEAPADVYLPAVDCAPIKTKGFDRIILEKAALFPDGIGVIRTPYINGVFPPALQAMTAGFVQKMGYIYNPEYPFWFIDHEIHDMARLIGRYLEVPVEVQTAETRPAKTIRLRDVAFWAGYYNMMALERRAKAREIIESLSDAPHVKAHLLDCYHGIENEARSINAGVMRNAAAIEKSRGEVAPPDEGYLRAKHRAEQKLVALIEQLQAA